MNRQIAFSILIATTLLAFIIPTQSVYAVITFADVINLSNDNVQSSVPRIALSGDNNVYAIWSQRVQDIPVIVDDIFFTKSTSTTLDAFDATINLSSGIIGSAIEQQIVASGNNVYVVWRNDTATDDIFFKRSTDNGATFTSAINLSTTGTTAQSPQIAISGNNVYIVWSDGPAASADIFFINSTDNGATFDPDGPFNLSLGGPIPASTLPQIVASGSNVYIVWRDGVAAATDDIFFRASTDNGNTFVPPLSSPAKNLSVGPLGPIQPQAQTPQIATSGNNVYVVWRDNRVGNFEIFFTNSTNNGATFDPDGPFNLSNDSGNSDKPQIEVSGNNVYVVWEEDPTGPALRDIFFKASADSSSTFSSSINLSQNTGASLVPQIAALDNNVYVVWQDLTVDANGDISFRSSSDNGATFDGVSNLSGNAGTSQGVQTVASVNGVNVIWDDTTDGDRDVLFRAGTIPVILPPDIEFNATQYKLSNTATITVTDQNSNLLPGDIETIDVNVASTADPTGITLSLSETDVNTGIFTGQLTFTTDISSSSVLQASPGNTITASFGGQTKEASIFSRMINFDFAEYDRGTIAHITVTDQNSNLLPGDIETIEVNVASTADPTGITLSLSETDINTGIFGGAVNSNLIFMEGNDLVPVPSSITITSENTDATGNGINNEVVIVSVISDSDPSGITISLTETDDTGMYSGTLTLTTDVSDEPAGKIKVSPGDFLTIGNGKSLSKALIVPNPNPSNGAIQVAVPDDTVTASYIDSSDIVSVEDLVGGGGGGGGIVRPTLVLDIVAGISALGSGGSGGNSPPSFETSSFTIISEVAEETDEIISPNNAKNKETKTFKVGEKTSLRFDFTEGGGIGKIEHIGLYTNVRDGQKRQDSDAYIYYDPLKSPQLTVHDPNGLFSDASFELLQKDATKFVLKFDLIFAKPMQTSDIILESWNTQKWSSINKIPNAIEVASSGILQEEQSEPIVDTFVEDVTDDQVIPVWIQSNAKWWSEDEIDTENFISGIEYLVNEGIIKVSLPETTTGASISEVQPWIKNTAGWWADDMISEDEFLTAIEWLISNNIIQVV